MRYLALRRAGLFTLVLVLSGFALAQQAESQPAPKPLTEDRRLVDSPDERVVVLSNGLTLILKAHRVSPAVTVRMYCQTGSIYEQEYLGCGMSHLFEHLLHSTATTTRTEEESRRILDRIGGNANAYTSYETTAYYINTGKENLATAVSLLGDWITRPTWPQQAFDREWGVVQRELERDVDNPERRIFQMTMETMYRVHPARFPIIGHKPVVQTLKKEDIVAYYHRMYVPDRMQVVIAGDIDLDAAQTAVCEEFAGFARRRVPTIHVPDEPEMTTPRFACKRMKVDAAMLQLAWPSIPLDHPDLYAIDVLSFVLTQGESSRLIREVRDRGLVFRISSSSWTPPWARGMFLVSARLAPDKLEQAIAAILAQVERVRNELVSTEELNQAKKQKAAEHVLALQTAEAIGENMARDFQATGDIHFSQAYVDNILKVTPEQVREAARRYLVPERLARIQVLPEGVAETSGSAVAESGPPKVRKVVLDNGLRCLIQPDASVPLVAIQSFTLGGVLFEDEKTNGLSQLIAYLAPRGTEKRSAEEIARFFDSRGGLFNGVSGNNTIYFAAQVLKDDFADALEVVADVVMHPVFPAEELDFYRPIVLDRIGQLDETWRVELMTYLDRHAFTHSPYRMPAVGSREVVSKATREDLVAFYRDRLKAADTVVAVYGDVDPDVAESLLRRTFGALPAGGSGLPKVEPEPTRDKPVLYIKAKPPTRAVAGVGLAFKGMAVTQVDDMAKMAVLDTVISGYRYPTGWLEEALRGGDRSLVYEVHAVNRPGPVPGAFQIYAACEPGKVAEVYTIVLEQLAKAREGKCTEAELARAKNIIATTDMMETQTNAERAMKAALDELYGLGYDNGPRFLERVKVVTLEDVQATARKYFTEPVVAVVTPVVEAVKLGIEPAVVDREPVSGSPDGETTP